MKKVLMLAGTDSCGMMYWMSEALNRYSVKYKSVHVNENKHPFEFPHEYLVKDCCLEELLEWSDFIQIGHSHYPYEIGSIKIPLDKVKCQYHTGFHYREKDDQELKEELSTEFGIELSFATPDLCKVPGGDHLVPLPYPIDSGYIAKTYSIWGDSIVHSPSSDFMKGSELVDRVVNRISDKHIIPCISTRDVSWEESLKYKARAMLYVDHMFEPYNSFGISAVESAILGAVPFAMGNNFNMEGCPFIVVNTEQELYDKLDYYLSNREELIYKSYECRKWALDNFSLKNTCRTLEEHYDKL